MKNIRWLAAISIFVWVPLFQGCRKGEASSEVVLYSSVDETYSRQVIRRFEEETGIKVKLVSDTEATKSTGLINRIIAERNNPVADVFWSGDVTRAAFLKDQGLLETLELSERKGVDGQLDDPKGYYYASAARIRLIIYNKDLVKHDKGEGPQSVMDLAKPEFANQSCLANPLFGTTSMHAAAIFSHFGTERAERFFNDFSQNGGRMLGSNGEVKRRVANGDYAYGLTDSDDVAVALADGKNIGYIIPDQEGHGTLLIPCAAAVIKGSRHSDEARKLVEFLISAEVEMLMAQLDASHFPLRENLDGPEAFPFRLSEIKTWSPSVADTAISLKNLQDGFLKEWVAQQHR